jgi:hypothetical protein
VEEIGEVLPEQTCDDELHRIRLELDQLLRVRRVIGFGAADTERYWQLTNRELELQRAR